MDVSKIVTALFLLTEVYSAHGSCNAPEGFPNAQSVISLEGLAHFDDGLQLKYRCDDGFTLGSSDGISTCQNGRWTSVECIQGCSGTSKANVYRATASGVKEDEPASSFDHEEYAIVKCHDHYVLTQDSKPVSDWKSKTSRCVFGKWEPEYACEKDACHVDVPENGKLWIKTANKTKQGITLMKNGYTGIFNCDQNYTLDNDTIVQHTDGYPITCVGNKLNTTLPTCVKNVPDSEESADMIYDNYGVQMGEAMESPAYEKSSITLTIPETTAAAAATKDATISSATTDVPLASTTPFSESPSTTKEEFHYDYPGVDEVKSEETCPNPANGRLVRSYLSYYNVVCDDGYELYVVENDDDYKCSNGKWMSKNFGFEAECNENDCEITDEILAIMKVFNRVNGKEQYVSRVRKIPPNQKYYFDCKQENHEPVKRLFNCSRGNWTAIERDPNWKMQIDGMEPSCRKALCDPVCQFGGTCVKDGMCKCVPGTTGKACEIPVCNPACASNGGKCEAPNTCKCEEPRYGINCEQVGCDRPNLPVHVIMKGTNNFFEDGDVLSSDQLTCSKGYILSNTTRCIGNQTWSGKAECLKEKTHFELEVKVGNSHWAGSWGELYVSILSEQGGIIHRMAFEEPDFEGLYPGQLYVISSTSGQNGKVGQLRLLLGPGNQDINDDLEIDHIRLTIQRDADNTKKEYDFSSVGFLHKNQKELVRPDTRVFRLKYRLGDAYYAESSDTLHISFEGNLGHTPFYLMSSGRRNKTQTYYKVIDGEYVGQIHTVTIVKQKVNTVPNDIQIDYIELTVSHEDKEEKYIFRNVGWIGSRKEIQPEISADQPEMPSCQDDFELSAGWIDTRKLLSHSDFTKYVKSDEECKNRCRKDGRCRVAAVRDFYERPTCQIVYTGSESAVNYRKNAQGFRLYTRKC